MKFNSKCVQNMYKLVTAICVVLLLVQCNTSDPAFKQLMTQQYPGLHSFIEQRYGSAILELTNHSDSTVREHAWRGLIQTAVVDVDLHIQKVLQANTPEAWASLWLKPINEQQLGYFHMLWQNESKFKPGLVTLFAMHGNEQTLELLLKEPLSDDAEFNRNLAYAIGERTRTLDLTEEQEIMLIDRALQTNSAKLTQAYLYGYYRGRKLFSKKAEQHLLHQWENYYPDGPEGDQSIARILMKNHTNAVLYHFDIERYSKMDVRLAIEIAQGLAANPATNYTPVILNTLLDHKNPNVKIEALRAMQQHPQIAERLFRHIMNKAALNPDMEPLVRMEAFNTITHPEQYRNEMLAVAGENPYLQTLKYKILQKIDSDEEFFEILQEDLSHPNRLNRFYAAQELSSWWPATSEGFKSQTSTAVKSIVTELFGQKDRSITIVLAPLLLDEQLFGDDEFGEIEQLLADYTLPDDVEVLQTYGKLFRSRFTKEATPLVTSWAEKGNIALNRTLQREGWNVAGNFKTPTFRSPDWKRLAKLGPNPYLVIETPKGEILLQLDVLKAPATISGMDSLITSGAYNGTPFHRVVSNFVIQGGDVESQDGYGGPGYTVPTEASHTMFDRGTVGIASAGTDTEGSQFFIMHQWKPHLNARYTVIGKVVEGMDVVDRIVQGDVITRMYWY